jgi:EAL domain-containing protein (putative c-di-GMP-specific phosphodiesterase class I)
VTHHLQLQAEAGPWVEPCDGERASAYGRLWAAAGLSAIASVPILGPDGLLGIVAVGSHSDDSAGLSQRWASILEFGAMAAALLSGPLAEQQVAASRQDEIWSTVAGRRFDPVFQPIVTLATGRVVGYEALTRFHDGADPSARFASAREVGLGLVLEEACLREALSDAAGLAPEAWLSLNASGRFVMDAPRLRRLLAGGTRPIVLEITEHEAVDDPGALRDAVVRLGDRVRTIRLAVDDAGAGFNGLQFILGLAPDLIKLDLNLTQGIEHDPAKQALVVGMHHFADQIGAQLVAEGVETRQARNTLLSLGVPLGQGYLLGAPAPVSAWRADGALAPATGSIESDAPGPPEARAAAEGDASTKAKVERPSQ